ncbi:Uncharacterised protein [Mycobacteroides abscessus subsp. massiliense]|uniref:hypothetical protein n=1 Tax=Mycobacteroides abscessus TaxID=36809 RepID=UPI0009A79510|nr:hypothetical protein [Mycobacteroides abscessus]SKU64789.1 Uncharacterised protein [Mycobacteroides abscessus subsp. massiliense]
MSIKRIGATLAVAGALALPLAACGSTPAPTVITVTPTTPMHPALQKIQDDADRRWSESHPGQDVNAHRAAERAAAQQPKSKSSGLPWWAWILIVPVGLVAALLLAAKVWDGLADRDIERASARLAELEARYPDRDDDDDVEDYPEDYDDELDGEDEYPRAAVESVQAPAPVPPAAGNLLSSLRQQGGA